MWPPTALHGREPRGLLAVPHSSVGAGRFGRLFRWLHPADFGSELEARAALLALAQTMQHGSTRDVPITERDPATENPSIPAGYTYLGQFIDHDITFDPVSSLQSFADPDALANFRTPRLDLDSVYGRGPADQPYLYDTKEPARFLTGPDKSFDERLVRPDLQRNSQHRALIGDPRNDENLLIAQLHVLFQRFHNAVVTLLAIEGKTPPSRIFEEAQRLVRWHYQWLVLHDYLEHVVGREMAREVRAGSPDCTPILRLYHPKSHAPYIPVEFSGAAFRFGHSMVRPSYALNPMVGVNKDADAKFNRIPIFARQPGPLADLRGRRELPDRWGIDWSFFFPVSGSTTELQIPQPSHRLNTCLVDPLTALPEFSTMPEEEQMLAARNLLRGWRLGLPSGQDIARFLGETPLSDDVLWTHDDPDRAAARQRVFKEHSAFRTGAPPWFYILREAELTMRDGVEDRYGGHHLGPVGGRIVAEVLVGLVSHDHYSYLFQQPRWKPTLAPNEDFTMPDLIRFVEFVESEFRS